MANLALVLALGAALVPVAVAGRRVVRGHVTPGRRSWLLNDPGRPARSVTCWIVHADSLPWSRSQPVMLVDTLAVAAIVALLVIALPRDPAHDCTDRVGVGVRRDATPAAGSRTASNRRLCSTPGASSRGQSCGRCLALPSARHWPLVPKVVVSCVRPRRQAGPDRRRGGDSGNSIDAARGDRRHMLGRRRDG